MEPTDLHPSEDPRAIVEYNVLRAADRLGLDDEMRTLLNMPFREVRVEIPLRMDDGSLLVFVGYRVQHSGVTVSYFEWAQNLQQVFWEEEHVNTEMQKILLKAYRQVAEKASMAKASMRESAYTIAVERVARAERLRGT